MDSPRDVCARVNTSLAQQVLVAAGIGVCLHLNYVADPDPRLVRIAEPADFGLSLWLLTHEDLRKTARIRALMSFVGDELTEQRSLMEGTGYGRLAARLRGDGAPMIT